MSKILLMFPGQGSQSVGMGKELYDSHTKAKEIIDMAGEELKTVIFEGPVEKLKMTKYTQPAIFTISVAVFEVFKENVDLNNCEVLTAGHSLGEYAALYAAGVFNFKDGLEMVKARGQYIQQASLENPGTMAAIMGMPKEDVENVCKDVCQIGVCEPVNYNCPGQIVIAGNVDAVKKACELANAKGAKRCIELNVSGPFHSSLMKSASQQMSKELEKYSFLNPKFGIYANYDAGLTKDVAQIKDKLVKQINHPVKWEQTITNAINVGVEKFIEIGPGKVLCGLLKRIDKTKKILNIEDNVSLENSIKEVNLQ